MPNFVDSILAHGSAIVSIICLAITCERIGVVGIPAEVDTQEQNNMVKYLGLPLYFSTLLRCGSIVFGPSR